MNMKEIEEAAERFLEEIKELHDEAQASKKKAIHDATMYSGAAEGVKLFFKQLTELNSQKEEERKQRNERASKGKNTKSSGTKKGKTATVRPIKSRK